MVWLPELELPVLKDEGRHEGPRVEEPHDGHRCELDPVARPAHVDGVLALLRRGGPPRGHHHARVHAGQGKDEMEKAVRVRNGLKLFVVVSGAARLLVVVASVSIHRHAQRLGHSRQRRGFVGEGEGVRGGPGPHGGVADRDEGEGHAPGHGHAAVAHSVAGVGGGLAVHGAEAEEDRVERDDGGREEAPVLDLGQQADDRKGHKHDQSERDEPDVSVTVGPGGVEVLVHDDDPGDAERVRARRERQESGDPPVVFLVDPRVVPGVREVQEDHHLQDEEEARTKPGEP
mmetsp:Transcript_14516/g.33381  ORF Transcript_14516/g.33381 Transcript_14516/m.33381 type:complete len:288 (-) Transcript_14516:537-1400(-)